jgi:hypothetical protein
MAKNGNGDGWFKFFTIAALGGAVGAIGTMLLSDRRKSVGGSKPKPELNPSEEEYFEEEGF